MQAQVRDIGGVSLQVRVSRTTKHTAYYYQAYNGPKYVGIYSDLNLVPELELRMQGRLAWKRIIQERILNGSQPVASPPPTAGHPSSESPEETPPTDRRQRGQQLRRHVERGTAKAPLPKRYRIHHKASDQMAGRPMHLSDTALKVELGSHMDNYIQQLKFYQQIYKHLGLPADLQDLVDRRAQEPALHEAFPWLVMVEAGLQFKTWRDALEKELQHKLQLGEHQDTAPEITADELRQMLFQVCKNMHNKPGTDKDWIQHWSQDQGHGPVAFMKLIKIIPSHPDSAKQDKLALGQDGNKWYEPCKVSLSHQVLNGILNIVGSGILAVRRMMPKNMQQLLQAFDAMRCLLARARVIEQDDHSSYCALWLSRSIMVAEMQFTSATIQLFKAPHAPQGCLDAQRLSSIGKALPDARERLRELEAQLGIKDILQLQNFLGWQQLCPSMVAINLCMFNEHLHQSKKVDWTRLLTQVPQHLSFCSWMGFDIGDACFFM
jgi:hypothetical protein